MLLKKGSKGENVKILQRFLKLKDDGDFGAKTESAVKDWQSKNGLTADGIVGTKTWSAMKLDELVTTDNSETITESTEGYDSSNGLASAVVLDLVYAIFLNNKSNFSSSTNKSF